MINRTDLTKELERLTGRQSSPSEIYKSVDFDYKALNLGYSQFNEIMLLHGFDRVNFSFFQFLASGSELKQVTDEGVTISNFTVLKSGIEKFLKVALLLFGNIKDAFQTLSNDSDELDKWLNTLNPIDKSIFKNRHKPILPVNPIPANKTYVLGYIVEKEIREKLNSTEEKEKLEAEREWEERENLIRQALQNQDFYLVSDHLDVYVATSMRQRHEYVYVSKVTKEIFDHESIKNLKLRYFDPTQAYCKDRIDKGLSEALMLKRSRCTIYLAQESETLGKDSELASTLAQGKTVIAFVPIGDKKYVDKLIDDQINLYGSEKLRAILLEQLQIFNPRIAWVNPEITESSEKELQNRLYEEVNKYYDKRADTLAEVHPLGLQVNLNTGVANGVLVVRKIDDCANLLRDIVTNNLSFYLEEKELETGECYLFLKEKISNCIYRAITANKTLTNSFWNFYT